jgi:hypothetical protein
MDCAVGIFEVGGDEASVAFLSGCVPHLESEVTAVAVEVFDVEVDADCILDV